jgi:hypothetical protein
MSSTNDERSSVPAPGVGPLVPDPHAQSATSTEVRLSALVDTEIVAPRRKDVLGIH